MVQKTAKFAGTYKLKSTRLCNTIEKIAPAQPNAIPASQESLALKTILIDRHILQKTKPQKITAKGIPHSAAVSK